MRICLRHENLADRRRQCRCAPGLRSPGNRLRGGGTNLGPFVGKPLWKGLRRCLRVGHDERPNRGARRFDVLVTDGGHGASRGIGVPGPLDLLERGDPDRRFLREHLFDEPRAIRSSEGDDGGPGCGGCGRLVDEEDE
ncbi:hypothetical protein EG835_03875, partial [bacterium]|nr:hypothetical protein [bacterium]